MKSGYDSLKIDLSKIADDEALKKDATIQGKLDDFLRKVARELTDENRDKQYDGILTETQSQVSALRSQIYGKSLDTKAVAPVVAVAGSAAVVAGASNTPGSTIEQAATAAQSQIQESTKGLR